MTLTRRHVSHVCGHARSGKYPLHPSALFSVEDLIPVFEAVIHDVLEGNMTLEHLESSRAKVLVALNEIIHLGEVANTDPAQILKLAKMKPLD